LHCIPKVLPIVRNGAILIPMVLTEQQQKTIDLLNPWFSEKTIDLGVNRSSYLKAISSITKNQKQILFLLGSRRVGKTMIIYQYIYQLIKENVLPQKILFLSLDNTNLQDLELFSYLAQSDFEYIFLDEVQYFPN